MCTLSEKNENKDVQSIYAHACFHDYLLSVLNISMCYIHPYYPWLPSSTWANFPDSKVHGANMGPIWGRQDPGGPHVGPMNFAIWVIMAQVPLKQHWHIWATPSPLCLASVRASVYKYSLYVLAVILFLWLCIRWSHFLKASSVLFYDEIRPNMTIYL